MDSLNTVIASLFFWISSHLYVINADFKQPPHYPEIKFITHEKLSQMACEKPCPVIGWYPTKNQIEGKEVLYMIKGVYPVNDLCIRTIFLHELVHFWQDYNNAFENSGDSEKVVFTRREQQAMILEHLYRGQQYNKYKEKTGKEYNPRCCKEIAFGRCVNNPGWINQYLNNTKK